MSIKRRLVLTFDAFGTLFHPKDTIGAQYALVAKKHGLLDYSSDHLNDTFRDAFKRARREYPNYGKATGMGASQWWSNVITETFTPVLRNQAVPDGLVGELLQRFSTSEGYALYADVLPFFQDLRARRSVLTPGLTRRDEIIVGIISNSDDRIGSILRSFGLSLSSRRFSPDVDQSVSTSPVKNDFDFVTLSYDVGFEKPHHQIFDAARMCAALPKEEKDAQDFFVHIGDDPVEDYQGAKQAGWEGLCISRHGRNQDYMQRNIEMSFLGDFNDLADYLWNDILSLAFERLPTKQD